MISSELPEVLGMSDRVLVMRGGRIVADFDRAAGDARERRRRDDAARDAARTGRRGMSDGRHRRTFRAEARPAARRASSRPMARSWCSPSRSIALFVVVGRSIRASSPANNLNSIFSGNAYIAVAAIGMSMVIISGNIDISVGSLIGVLATIRGTLAVNGYPIWVSWLAPILIGIARQRASSARSSPTRGIPSIVVTLGMLSILKGGLISVTGGAWITNLPPSFHSRRCARSASRCRSISWWC